VKVRLLLGFVYLVETTANKVIGFRFLEFDGFKNHSLKKQIANPDRRDNILSGLIVFPILFWRYNFHQNEFYF